MVRVAVRERDPAEAAAALDLLRDGGDVRLEPGAGVDDPRRRVPHDPRVRPGEGEQAGVVGAHERDPGVLEPHRVSLTLMIPGVNAWRDAEPRPYWFPPIDAPAPEPLRGRADADLCIVGGGFTGLWAALAAVEREPGRRVVLLEAEQAGFGGSGRNGGFCMASLTHGIGNGLARFPEEMTVLERLGRENLDGLVADLAAHRIDCDWEPVGDVLVATRAHEEPWMDEEAALLRAHGNDVEVWDGDRVRREIASPTYRRAVWNRTGGGILDPGKLARGLRDSARRTGVDVFEGTPAVALERDGAGVRVVTPEGEVRAEGVLLATGASAPLVRAIRRYVAPVYDYVLVTEPLSTAQRASLGWDGRQGVGDSGNRFHYYRLTADDRILWGGYEAVYRFGGPRRARAGPGPGGVHGPRAAFLRDVPAARRAALHPPLGRRDRHVQPLLRVLRHRARRERGLRRRLHRPRGRRQPVRGRTALDLLDGRETEVTALRYVRSRPCRSRPSRCAARSSSSRGTGSRPRTSATAAAGSGSGRSTRSASASTPRGGGRSAPRDAQWQWPVPESEYVPTPGAEMNCQVNPAGLSLSCVMPNESALVAAMFARVVTGAMWLRPPAPETISRIPRLGSRPASGSAERSARSRGRGRSARVDPRRVQVGPDLPIEPASPFWPEEKRGRCQ